jgi:hypothetical protein
MTTPRKWGFFTLIGAGLIAAGALVYFSNGHISTSKTQGTIGQRDVYRDGQVASADVAQPGSAPVATEAILKSSEFKALAKNAAFQALLRDESFNEVGRRSEFADILANPSFWRVAQDGHFLQLILSDEFKQDLGRRLSADQLIAAVRNNSQYGALIDHQAFDALIRQYSDARSVAFGNLLRSAAFGSLLGNVWFKTMLGNRDFERLAARADFREALTAGTAAQLVTETGRR